jgi:hypothetical protein
MSDASVKKPLSQASAKKKILVALPLALLFGGLFAAGIAPQISMMLCALLSAYAIVGILELILGGSLRTAASRWDRLPGWQQGFISVFVICAAFFVAVAAIRLIGS